MPAGAHPTEVYTPINAALKYRNALPLFPGQRPSTVSSLWLILRVISRIHLYHTDICLDINFSLSLWQQLSQHWDSWN